MRLALPRSARPCSSLPCASLDFPLRFTSKMAPSIPASSTLPVSRMNMVRFPASIICLNSSVCVRSYVNLCIGCAFGGPVRR